MHIPLATWIGFFALTVQGQLQPQAVDPAAEPETAGTRGVPDISVNPEVETATPRSASTGTSVSPEVNTATPQTPPPPGSRVTTTTTPYQSTCADELRGNRTKIMLHNFCTTIWDSTVPEIPYTSACQICNRVPWFLKPICKRICSEVGLDRLNVVKHLGDLVCCDQVINTRIPWGHCFDTAKHPFPTRRTNSRCLRWENSCKQCCRALATVAERNRARCVDQCSRRGNRCSLGL